jgi:hypothetical protein
MPVHNAGVADIIGAASLLVSKAALPSLVSLALGGPGAAAEDAPEPEDEPAADEPEKDS